MEEKAHDHRSDPAMSMSNHNRGASLFVAFELSEKAWKLGFTTGHGQKPRERTVDRAAAGARAPRNRPGQTPLVVCRKRRRWSVAMKRGVKASGCIAFCRAQGITNHVVDSSSIAGQPPAAARQE